MTIRRLLTSLAAHQPTPSHSASRLIPPYSHVYSATTPSTLRPPYSYSASPAQGLPLGAHEVRGRSLKAKVKYEIYHREGKIDGWSAWAENVLGSEEQRRKVEAAWVETLAGLESIKSSGVSQLSMEFIIPYVANVNCRTKSRKSLSTLWLATLHLSLPSMPSAMLAL